MGKDFKYNGYTFRPLGDKNMSFEAACRRISSDRELGMSTYNGVKEKNTITKLSIKHQEIVSQIYSYA